MQNKFEKIDADSEDKDGVIKFYNSMFKFTELIKAIKNAFQSKGLDELDNNLRSRGGVPIWREMKNLWFNDGVEAEVLRLNRQGWQKGKIRIQILLEFCPDEPEITQTSETTDNESPLDDLRRMINE